MSRYFMTAMLGILLAGAALPAGIWAISDVSPPFEWDTREASLTLENPVELVAVTTTTFMMGATDEGDDALANTEQGAVDEKPLHEVTVAPPFYIGKYEVTNGQYAEVMNWALGQGRLQNAAGEAYDGGDLYLNGEMLLELTDSGCQLLFEEGAFTWKTRDGHSMKNHPVVMVTWYGAVAFCNGLSEMEGMRPAYDLSNWALLHPFGKGYRLPTEAEWECAARGSEGWIYGYQSDQATTARMNLGDANPLNLTDPPHTTPVGYYNGVNPGTEDSPSPFGAYDMSGNVWEWIQDWYAADYYEESPSMSPLGPATGDKKTLRSGDWMHEADFYYCRTASRSRAHPHGRANDSGFRVVRLYVPDPPANQPPAQPVNVYPEDGMTGVAVDPHTVILWASDFADPDGDDSHAASQWQVADVFGDFSNPVWESLATEHPFTSATISLNTLDFQTTYTWRVRYQDNRSAWSDWSEETSFTTSGEPADAGDVNNDGAVDALDASLINEHLVKKNTLTGEALARADANEDGIVNLQDVVWVTNQFSPHVVDEITLTLPGDVPLVLVKIPAGSFDMGSPPDEQDRDDDEGPVHTVTIDYDFYLAKYELTKAQWEAVMGTTPWSLAFYVLDAPNSPAVVSWDDAQSFLTALNTHLTNTGQGTVDVRLPSEAEWEYACRAGTTTRFYWGDDPGYTEIGNYAWWYGNAWDAYEAYAHVVGQKLPNAWGLYDMSGNVWEWCQDDWHGDYTGAPTDGSAWGDGSGAYRVTRGGSWDNGPQSSRSANRYGTLPSYTHYQYGFRLAGASLGDTNTTPAQPTNQSPSDGAKGVSLTPILSASAFSDPDTGDTHAASQWRIRHVSGDYGSPIWDSGTDSSNLTARTVPDGILQTHRDYYWQVRYQDSKGYWSEWSAETGFQTYQDLGQEITLTLPGDVPLVLVKIPAGSFDMGSPPDEQDRDDDEGPVHRVNIAYDFYMGKYELTKAQWTAVMGTTPWSGESWVLDDPGSPATHVSWNDAQDFMEALNTHLTNTGQASVNIRLPSEAEWEYACRAGTTTRFYWGDDPDYSQIGDYAWYMSNKEGPYAHVVGQKLPNAWGLYDMIGNVWEWCQDDWHGDYTGAPTDGSAWGDGSGSDRVVRGGGWSNSAGNCRSGDRLWLNPDSRYSDFGFRVAGDFQEVRRKNPADGDTISLGETTGSPGDTVEVPVTFDASVDCAGLLLRLEYDATRLQFQEIAPGGAVAVEQALTHTAQEAGQLYFTVVGLTTTTAFNTRTGEVARLTFKIRDDAPAGEAYIGLTEKYTPELPVSNLVHLAAGGVAHRVVEGKVKVDSGEVIPKQPTNLFPIPNATGIGLNPVLEATAMVNDAPEHLETHTASQWQVELTWSETDYRGVVFDAVSEEALTSMALTGGALDPGNTYEWRVRHKNSTPAWGEWSESTEFSTARQPFPLERVEVTTTTFWMGASDGGDDALANPEPGGSDEKPRHEVTLNDYHIGKYEVTNSQYAEVLNWALENGRLQNAAGETYSGGDLYLNGEVLLEMTDPGCQIFFEDGTFQVRFRDGHGMGDHPVVMVTWYGAVAFCNWLSEMQERAPAYDLETWMLLRPFGEGYRLPTEAEWECAAKGTEGWIYAYQSDQATTARMNLGDGNPLNLADPPHTTPVGYYDGRNPHTQDSPSPFGAYDMSGNVWEWTQDWYAADYYAESRPENPFGPFEGDKKALRSGDWMHEADLYYCRTASRSRAHPYGRANDSGFRVVIPEKGEIAPPEKPVNLSPAEGEVVPDRFVTFETSPYSAKVTAYPHQRTKLLVYEVRNETQYDSIINTNQNAPLTTFRLDGSLARRIQRGNTYAWKVSYGDSRGNYTEYSDFTHFTVKPSNFPLETVEVPAGAFMQGAKPDEDHAESDENPRHEVQLTDYNISETEITNGAYCEALNWAKISTNHLENADGVSYRGGDVYWRGGQLLLKLSDPACGIAYDGVAFVPKEQDGHSLEDHPVTMVTWHGAAAFCNLAAKLVNEQGIPDGDWFYSYYNNDELTLLHIHAFKGYRLPTEAEWERAAGWNGSGNWLYGYGADNADEDLMTVAGNNPLGLVETPYTTPAGYYDGENQALAKSPVGCFDMSGNAREWCQDWYDADYYGESAVLNPVGPQEGSLKALRGGDWENPTQNARVANRESMDPTSCDYRTGFRVVKMRGSIAGPFNDTPERPEALQPEPGATDVSLTPTLKASAFHDSDGDRHLASQWQIFAGTCETDYRGQAMDMDLLRETNYCELIFDSESNYQNLTSFPTVQKVDFEPEKTYSWRVRYMDSRGLWGHFSRNASFTCRAEHTEKPDPHKWSDDFGYDDWYRHGKHIRRLGDVNGDGLDDIVAFGDSGVWVALSAGNQFSPTQRWDQFFTHANWWRVEKHPRMVADMNGDGMDDIVGFGDEGVFIGFSTGEGFTEPQLVCLGFGYKDGWRVRDEGDAIYMNLDDFWGGTEQFCLAQQFPGHYVENPRFLVDVDGDGSRDIAGFYREGVAVALNDGQGFFPDESSVWLEDFNILNGWRSDRHGRFLADVNGDGRADAVGLGDRSVLVALCVDNDGDGKGDGFAPSSPWLENMTRNKGWQVNLHPRVLEDLDHDGKADLAGFGDMGIFVALAGDGAFLEPVMVVPNYGKKRGWNNPLDYPRWFHDLDGDHNLDVLGFGNQSAFYSLFWDSDEDGQADRLTPAAPWVHNFSRGQGWNPERHLRLIGDVDGDGLADIVGFGEKGVFVY